MDEIVEGYATAAKHGLIARFEAISSVELYKPVLDLLPQSPVRIADIGAGTGRDAAWFARQGHRVLAVEPVDELRKPGMAMHRSANIEWLKDQLPELRLSLRRGQFDLIVLCAVWQHLHDGNRLRAMVSLSKLIVSKGILVMSLRHGPGAPNRPVFPVVPEDTISAASRLGFSLARKVDAASIQAENRSNGVQWTWLVFRMK
jgi:SAM-dependent methyltransferase